MADLLTHGGCLCGGVRFSGHTAEATALACHCSQCRRWSGHFGASFRMTGLQIEGDAHLRWFASSPEAERGFCATCGSSLFWRPFGREAVAVSAGAIDAPTGLRLSGHIHTADKGDYYEIADGLPQFAGDDEDETE
ncbi:GFA family protein [Paracoccus caeni]|uniref:GFA family protein n=1 Tax=Paracoccus caeni TaxID=657651 RepID=UPI002D7F2820|nr:GFA family protein [Paracoccus caeni]